MKLRVDIDVNIGGKIGFEVAVLDAGLEVCSGRSTDSVAEALTRAHVGALAVEGIRGTMAAALLSGFREMFPVSGTPS